MDKKVTLTVMVEPKLKRALERIARKEATSLGHVVRRMLDFQAGLNPLSKEKHT